MTFFSLNIKTFILAGILLLNSLIPAIASSEDTISHIEKILPSNCVFSGDFIQEKTIETLTTPLLSSGKLFFSCQHGLIWKTEQPFPESVIYTPVNLHYRHMPDEQVVPLNGPQHNYLANFLLDLLRADTASIQNNFLIEVVESSTNEKRVMLSPTDSFIKKGLNNILLEKIHNNQETLLNITITDIKKQNTKISIKNFKIFSKDIKTDINNECLLSLKENISCDIVANPLHYQVIDPSN